MEIEGTNGDRAPNGATVDLVKKYQDGSSIPYKAHVVAKILGLPWGAPEEQMLLKLRQGSVRGDRQPRGATVRDIPGDCGCC